MCKICDIRDRLLNKVTFNSMDEATIRREAADMFEQLGDQFGALIAGADNYKHDNGVAYAEAKRKYSNWLVKGNPDGAKAAGEPYRGRVEEFTKIWVDVSNTMPESEIAAKLETVQVKGFDELKVLLQRLVENSDVERDARESFKAVSSNIQAFFADVNRDKRP
jgi:hypothetical protein